MAAFETKFSIGDVVYRASIATVTKQHPCPDCKGSRKWKAISPAGSEYDFTCPRCSSSYQSNRDLSLSYAQCEPSINCLTIGSVRVDTHERKGNQYMCLETGVGSGNIYYESDLFHTEDEALKAAKQKAAVANVEVEWVAKLYDKTLSLSDYELTSAEREANKLAHRESMGNIRSFFRGIEWSDDVEEMKALVKEFHENA